MNVGVGSTNPVKVEATERALEANVEAVAVDSGVPEQPRGTEQTIRGAQNRARRALGERDLGVGIEGGVADVQGELYLIMWAAVTDGQDRSRGGGPSIPLPQEIARRVRDGEELGPVMDEVTGQEGTKRSEGAAGVLTGGHTDRTTVLEQTVAAALGPFVTDHY